MSEAVTFDVSGRTGSGALGLPPDGKAPAVVLIQEWWGINDHIRFLVDRLAAAGFLVLAPDLYGGVVAKDATQAGELMQGLDWAAALETIGAAAAHLRAHPRGTGRVGVMGFCMGGALSFKAATIVRGLGAVVPFYGVPDPSTDYSTVEAPILAHFAKRDGWAKPEAAEAIRESLTKGGKAMELHIYDADHAFVNDTRPDVYSEECAKLAWDRTVQFLHVHLD